jgi:hypothetical protein
MIRNTIIDIAIVVLGMATFFLLLVSAAKMSETFLGYAIVCLATSWTMLEFQARHRVKPKSKYPRSK